MKSYLIQRGKFEDRDYKKGLDSIVELDYMGAAEFEFGALPKSLANIRNRIQYYIYFDISIGTNVVTVFCYKDKKDEIRDYLNLLADGKMTLHERSDFDNWIHPSKYYQSKINFWWDIENDLMFWKHNPEFELKFKSIISIKPT